VDILFGFAYNPDVRVRRISQALAGAGYRVRILAWDRSELLPERDTDAPVEVLRVHVASHQGRGWTQLFYLATAVAKYVPHILRRRPDVLHAIDLPMLLAALLIAPLTRRRPRIVYDAFEIYQIMESHKYPGWLLRVIGVMERLLPRFADLVITPGIGRHAYFADRGIESVVVSNWVNPPATTTPRADARRALGLDDDDLVVLYAGGLDPSRDLASLVAHAERTPEHVVLIAGQGEQEPELRRRAKGLPNLRILGWFPDPSLPLAASDMLYYSLVPTHPYAAHAAPNNLYTAIAHALPLVYRPQGELAVIGAAHRIGEQFHDAPSLDRAISRLGDPSTNAAVRDELRSLRETYAWDAAARVLLEAYPRPPAVTTSSESTNGE
jgi:glycosyltransferase involved in cell wall biosynthesis